ncbi:MAG: hypothetical protein E6Q94_04630 [Burkholderiaceae bacterium]|nr:MAG: hypothetical protein E6Q94_04630 [Burkholderiaceae bacterium]
MTRSTPTHRPQSRRTRGYVLLFVLGLLIVVSTLVLGTSSSLRIDARLLAHEKDTLQEAYLLEGAARLTAAQLDVTRAMDELRLPVGDTLLRGWEPWRADGSTYNLQIADLGVRVTLDDVSGLPDANALLPAEWERLFMALGAPSRQAAQEWTQAVVQMRSHLLSIRGGSGFSSLQELLSLPILPRPIVEGGSERTPLGLRDLLIVGSGSKTVDLEKTPLILIQSMGQLTDNHVQLLLQLRQEGAIPAATRQAWAQGTGLTVIQPTAQPIAVRAALHLSPDGRGNRSRIAIITSDNTKFRVADMPPPRMAPP